MPNEAGQPNEEQVTEESNVNINEKLIQQEQSFNREKQDIIARRDNATAARREAFELMNQMLPDGNKIDLTNPNLETVRNFISNKDLNTPTKGKGNNTNTTEDFSAQLEQHLSPLKKQMAELEQMASTATRDRDNFMLGNTIKDTVLANGGAKGPLDAVTRILRDMMIVDTKSGSAKVILNREAVESAGYQAVKVDDGHDVVLLSVEEFIKDFLPKNSWALDGAGGGAGSNWSRNNGQADVNMNMFNGLSDDQQRAAYRNLSPQQKQSIKNQRSLSGKKTKIWG